MSELVPLFATNDHKLKLEVFFLLRKLKAHTEFYTLNDELTVETTVRLCCEMMKTTETKVLDCLDKLHKERCIILHNGYVRTV